MALYLKTTQTLHAYASSFTQKSYSFLSYHFTSILVSLYFSHCFPTTFFFFHISFLPRIFHCLGPLPLFPLFSYIIFYFMFPPQFQSPCLSLISCLLILYSFTYMIFIPSLQISKPPQPILLNFSAHLFLPCYSFTIQLVHFCKPNIQRKIFVFEISSFLSCFFVIAYLSTPYTSSGFTTLFYILTLIFTLTSLSQNFTHLFPIHLSTVYSGINHRLFPEMIPST